LLAAMVGEPHLLVLDEPTDGLDAAVTGVLAGVLREHVLGGGVVLMATHDRAFIAEVGAKVMKLEGGVLQADGGAAG
jgi:ATPase subunit of ABC transporter with duplicated ATPase domains